MKAYKGFNRDMTCRGYKFAEGDTYEHEGDVKLCKSGFNACQDPMDCLRYYDPCTSVYHEVEIDGVSDERKGDTKVVGKKIRIGARIGIAEMVKASVDLTFAACSDAENADSASGDGSRQAASGSESSQETTGKNCVMMSAGAGGMARGKIGSWIVLTEWVYGAPNVVAKRIDGEEIKEDTLYMAKGGKLVEAE